MNDRFNYNTDIYYEKPINDLYFGTLKDFLDFYDVGNNIVSTDWNKSIVKYHKKSRRFSKNIDTITDNKNTRIIINNGINTITQKNKKRIYTVVFGVNKVSGDIDYINQKLNTDFTELDFKYVTNRPIYIDELEIMIRRNNINFNIVNIFDDIFTPINLYYPFVNFKKIYYNSLENFKNMYNGTIYLFIYDKINKSRIIDIYSGNIYKNVLTILTNINLEKYVSYESNVEYFLLIEKKYRNSKYLAYLIKIK